MVHIPPIYGDLGDGLWHCFTHTIKYRSLQFTSYIMYTFIFDVLVFVPHQKPTLSKSLIIHKSPFDLVDIDLNPNELQDPNNFPIVSGYPTTSLLSISYNQYNYPIYRVSFPINRSLYIITAIVIQQLHQQFTSIITPNICYTNSHRTDRWLRNSKQLQLAPHLLRNMNTPIAPNRSLHSPLDRSIWPGF